MEKLWPSPSFCLGFVDGYCLLGHPRRTAQNITHNHTMPAPSFIF